MKKAFFVIDMLRDFIEKDGKLYIGEAGKSIVGALKEKIAQMREENVPIYYICDNHSADDREFLMFPAHCLTGTDGGEIIPELCPAAGDPIIRKRRYCAFFGTDLDLTLREHGIEEVILSGVCTNICVLYTAATAVMLGYRVSVISDCVASFDEEAHKFALREMEDTLGAKIL